MPPRQAILDMLESGRELGLPVLKASVRETERSSVESIVEGLVSEGLVVRVKKHKYRRME